MTIEEQVKILKSLFRGRKSAYALFNSETENYVKKDGLVNDELIRDHITGKKTIAIYPLDRGENTCSFGVLDLDQKNTNLLNSVIESFKYFKIPIYIERSKSKGFHVHVFFEKPIPASKVRRLLEIIKDYSLAKNNDKVEIFPKQDSINENSYGNPILLPFNKIVAKPFLDYENGFKPIENQWEFLQKAKKIKEEQVDKVLEKHKNDQIEELEDDIEEDFEFITAADLLESKEKTKWIIESLIPSDGLSMLVGSFKHFKTWVLLEMARCVARGDKFLNHFKTEKGKVVYLDEENGKAVLFERATQLGISKKDQIMFSIKKSIDFYTGRKIKKMKEKIEKINPVLIIIDNLMNVHSALEENSATEMMRVFKGIKSLLSPERAIVVSHHYGHQAKRIRGTSAMSGDLVSEIHISLKQKQLKLHLKNTRYKKIDPFLVDIEYDTNEVPQGFVYSSDVIIGKKDYEKEVINILKKKSASVEELTKELNTNRSPIDKIIKRLVDKKIKVAKVKAHNEKVYALK